MSSSFDPDTTAPSEPAAALDAVQRCFWVWLIRWQLPFQPKGALLLLPEAAQPWGAAELYPRPPGAYFSSFLRGHCLLSTRSASVVRKRISKRVCLCLTWTRTPPVPRRSQGDPSRLWLHKGFCPNPSRSPGTVGPCRSLRCGTAALRWLGPRFRQPAAGSGEATTHERLR